MYIFWRFSFLKEFCFIISPLPNFTYLPSFLLGFFASDRCGPDRGSLMCTVQCCNYPGLTYGWKLHIFKDHNKSDRERNFGLQNWFSFLSGYSEAIKIWSALVKSISKIIFYKKKIVSFITIKTGTLFCASHISRTPLLLFSSSRKKKRSFTLPLISPCF